MPTSSEELVKACIDHLWMFQAQMNQVAKVGPTIMAKGEGVYLQDITGKRYIDMMSYLALMNIGYGRKDVVEAVAEQMKKLVFTCPVGGVASIPAVELAKTLAEITPGDLSKVLYAVSGSEANESAFKIARQYYANRNRRKFKIISRWISYQGATLGAMSSSGITFRRERFEPLALGFIHVFPPYCYRCQYGLTYPECGVLCAKIVEDVIRYEGPDTVCAFIADPITSWGVMTPPAEYFTVLRKICDEYDVLLIIDEVASGFGRTGKMFACEHWNVVPDIMTLAKGLTGGYQALAAVVCRPKVADAFLGESEEDLEFRSIHTYGGAPPACAAALAVIEIMKREKLVERAAELGRHLERRLVEIKQDSAYVGDVRGKGLFWGIEVVKNKGTKEIFDSNKLRPLFLKNMLKAGVYGTMIPMDQAVGVGGGLVELCPPLVIDRETLDDAVNRIESAINTTCKELV